MDIVLGGSGFIGSHLVDALLAQGRTVHVIDNTGDFTGTPDGYDLLPSNLVHHYCKDKLDGLPHNLTYENTDIREDDLDFTGADRVFHLAALADIVPSIENPVDYYDTNVTGTMRVLEAARKAKVKKVIYTASASCYGKETFWKRGDEIYTSVAENFPVDPQYPYALTKFMGEQLVAHWANVYKLSCVSMRLFNVYGTRSRTQGAYGAMFGTFLAQRAHGKPLTIVGDGTQKRDFVHVSDVVRALIMAGNHEGVFNVGTGLPTSVNYIAKLIGGETIHIPKRPGEPDRTCANISKIKEQMGWEPSVSLEEGIAELLKEDFSQVVPWTAEAIESTTKSWFEALG